jgi:type IV pilus assembly protein PilM
MWFQRAKPLVGIDIGSHAIKLVHFSHAGGQFQLLNLAMVPIPPDTVVDGAINQPMVIQDTLRRLTKLEKITAKDVALALSGHSVIVKKVQMVQMSEEELANAMPHEAEQHIPFDVYDVNTDFQILEVSDRPGGRSGQMDVLLAAAKKERVEELSRVAQAANLRPAVIDVDTLALMNVFELNYPDEMSGQVISLVHLGASTMTVLILKDGMSTFQRDIAIGGNQFTAELQKAFALNREAAEAVKLGAQADALPQSEVLAVLHKMTHEVVAEIQRSFAFYLASAAEEAIGKVYLSGGCARMKGLDQLLAMRLRLPVEILNPFRYVAVPETLFDTAYVQAMAPMVAVAAGLALRQKGDR